MRYYDLSEYLLVRSNTRMSMWRQGETKRECDARMKVCKLEEGDAVVVFRNGMTIGAVTQAAFSRPTAFTLSPYMPLEAGEDTYVYVADPLQFLPTDSLEGGQDLLSGEGVV
jgi:hypothetical protein